MMCLNAASLYVLVGYKILGPEDPITEVWREVYAHDISYRVQISAGSGCPPLRHFVGDRPVDLMGHCMGYKTFLKIGLIFLY